MAACTILLKAHQTIPGNKIILAGNGPLLVSVGYYVLKFGGKVDAIVDTSSKFEWIKSVISLIFNPKNFIQGISWISKVIFSILTIYSKTLLKKVDKTENGISVTIENIKNKKIKELKSEVLAVGHGLIPSTDISRLLKVNHLYNELKGGWTPKLDEHFKSSMKGFYIVGDGSGISGAIAAEEKGELAAISILKELNLIDEKEFQNDKDKIIKKLKDMKYLQKELLNLMLLQIAL